jgi:hypothetical protein
MGITQWNFMSDGICKGKKERFENDLEWLRPMNIVMT